MEWATHKDAEKYAHLDNGPVERGPYKGSVLPPSQLTPEARAHRLMIHQRRRAELLAGTAAIAGLAPVMAPKKGGGD